MSRILAAIDDSLDGIKNAGTVIGDGVTTEIEALLETLKDSAQTFINQSQSAIDNLKTILEDLRKDTDVQRYIKEESLTGLTEDVWQSGISITPSIGSANSFLFAAVEFELPSLTSGYGTKCAYIRMGKGTDSCSDVNSLTAFPHRLELSCHAYNSLNGGYVAINEEPGTQISELALAGNTSPYNGYLSMKKGVKIINLGGSCVGGDGLALWFWPTQGVTLNKVKIFYKTNSNTAPW